jgi:organic hydroperoxide reductase OsmC/OhrA
VLGDPALYCGTVERGLDAQRENAMRLEVSFRRVEDTCATLGWAGTKTVIADRRAGSAGGSGLGLSGGELQALALGAGFCNQLYFSADQLALRITALSVDVALELDGEPLLVTGATLRVHVEVESGAADPSRLLEHATAESTISNSVARGFPVGVEN